MSWHTKLPIFLGEVRTATSLGTLNPQPADFDSYIQLLAKLSQSWLVVYWVELPLRNAIHRALVNEFGPQWWTSSAFRSTVGSKIADDALSSKWAAHPERQFLDDLSFGFWIRCLSPSLEQRLWTPLLRHHFVQGVNRKKLHNQLLEFKRFRNAIAHHEHRTSEQLDRNRKLALEIAACIDADLPALIRQLADGTDD
jgi:hypothetical protein